MRTKNAKTITRLEHEHMLRVKSLSCSVCDDPGPCDAHHIKQGNHFTVVALCKSCHQHPVLGYHGQKRMWNIKKMDELSALNETIKKLMGEGGGNGHF